MMLILYFSVLTLFLIDSAMSNGNFLFYDPPILCTAEFKPAYCGFPNVSLSTILTVDDIQNCGPGVLPIDVRNYYYGTSGRAITYMRNLAAFKDVAIIPRMFRDVSKVDLSTTVLGERIAFPLGISPTAAHKLAHPDGEIGTARGVIRGGGVMILSSVSNQRIEDVAASVRSLRGPNGEEPVLWMQTYIYKNRQEVLSIIRRAENSGFKAIVVTSDSPIVGNSNCGSKMVLDSPSYPNLFANTFSLDKIDPSVTFEDLNWLVRNTRLPVVSKGLLTGDDAVRAARAGVSAILVSNHGGRQLDSDQATLDALPEVVDALRKNNINIEVYMDGGVRSGFDMYKAMARGARAVFVGRPAVWALAIAGESGVNKMMTILQSEFNETMILSGTRNVREINDGAVPTSTATTAAPTNPPFPVTLPSTLRPLPTLLPPFGR